MNPYWTKAPLPTAEELEQGCKSVAGLLKEARAVLGKKKATEVAHLLFGLSRVSLPDVRANLFWPEVAREFRARSGLEISETGLPVLYRGWLAEAYGEIIDWETHHKYVGLVFEQAGIGSGRDRVIRDFLQELVDALADWKPDRNSKDLVREVLRMFEERMRSSRSAIAGDIAPLRNVLLRAGNAVAEFASFVREYPQNWRLAAKEWEEVKKVWHDASGVDPETLTPSAHRVLHEIVSWLARTAARRDVFRAMKEGSIVVRLPGAIRAEQVIDWTDLPIGPARIKGAFGEAAVELVDVHAFTPTTLLKLKRDDWISYEELHFRVSDHEFTATLPGGRVRHSVALYEGNSPERATQRASYCMLDVRPVDRTPEPGGKPRAAPNRLILDWTFFYDPTGLKLRIRGFKVPEVSDARTARLTAGSEVVWSGQIDEGVPVGWAAKTIVVLPQHIETDCVVVRYEDEEETEYRIRLSIRNLWRPALIAVRGRIIPEHTVTPIDFPNGIYLYVAEGAEPRCEGAELTKSGLTAFAGHEFAQYAIRPFVGRSSSTVFARGREWRFVESVSFSTNLALPLESSIGNVNFSVTGPLRLARAGSQIVALLRPSSPWTSPPDYLHLHIKEGGELRLPIEASHIALKAEEWMIDVSRTLEVHGVPHNRNLTFGIGAWDGEPDEWFTVCFVESATIQPCHLDDVPSVMLDGPSGEIVTATAREPVDYSAALERKSAIAYVDYGEGRAWLSWVPIIEDVSLNDQAGTKHAYRIAAADLDPGPLTIAAFGGAGSEWFVSIGEATLGVASGGRLNISEAVRQTRTASACASLGIRAEQGTTRLTWELLDIIATDGLSGAWQPIADGVLSLDVLATVKALVPNAVRVTLRAKGRMLCEEEVELRSMEGGVSRQELRCTLRLPAAAAADGLAIELQHRDVVVGSLQLSPPPALVEQPPVVTIATVDEIRAVLKQFRQSGNNAFGERAIELLALYVAERQVLPMSQETLLAQVMNARPVDSGIRRLMVDCIRLIADTTNERAPVIPDYRRDAPAMITLILASLTLFQQARLVERGWMEPRVVAQACDQLEQLADSGPQGWRPWCHWGVAFGKSLTGTPAVLPSEASTNSLHLAGLSKQFQQWLLERKEHEHQH